MRGAHRLLSALERLRRLAIRLFPERHLHLRSERRVVYLRLSPASQMVAFAILASAVGWSAFASVSYLLFDRIMAAKENEISNATLAYRSILVQVSEYQKRFMGITRDLEENHQVMLRLVEQNAALKDNLSAAESRLHRTERDKAKVAETSDSLRSRLAAVQEKIRSMISSREAPTRDGIDSIEADLQHALAERNQVLFDRTQMRRHIRELESRLANLEQSQQDVVQRLTEQAVAQIESIERVVEITGIPLDRLLTGDKSARSGQGGPFIAATPDTLPAAELKVGLGTLNGYLGHWETLQTIVRRLPLAVPLDTYSVGSGFGKRRDPINSRWAMHYGLDLIAEQRAPVYATAPGTVITANYDGRYGNTVEVDHGANVVTRYAHLHKILVKKGQKVGFREVVGQVGSTGRSTGVHLHYEVLFRGVPKDPMNFIRAGQYVFQDQQG